MFEDKIITKISKKINANAFLIFLRKLNKSYKKLCIIMDNATWHLTKKVLQFCKDSGIKIIRLLPYSPELNPIEQYWQNIKKWLGTKVWASKEELEKQLRASFKKKELMLKSNGY